MHRTMRAVAPILGAFLLVLSLAGSAFAADKYVALGDSYSAGNGANSTNLNYGCNRNTYSYPYQVAVQRGNTSLYFPACSGATTSDVLNNQLGSLTADTKFVTITIGGNDVGFTNLIVACTTLGCQAQISSSNSQITNTLPSRLNSVYSAIRSRAPSARVMVLGYPRPFAGRGCLGTLGIDGNEMTQLNALTNNLDNVIRSRSQAYGFTYLDPNSRWTGHDVCSSSAYTNGLVVIPATDSYHPTRAGYLNGYTPLVRSIIG
jgi:lysophospholipase L1-like esterase